MAISSEQFMQATAAPRARVRATAPLFLLWGAALVLSPIYLLDPGSPQPSHVFFAGFFALSATCYFAPVRVDRAIWFLAGLWLLDVWLVNTVWWLLTFQRDRYFLASSIFYSFNVGVMLAVASLAAVAPKRFSLVTRVALGIALLYEIAIALSGTGTRSSGTFNNPNQLGYWSLLVATCWLAMKPREPLKVVDLAVLGGVIALCMISASRAAMLGAFALLGFALWFHPPRSRMIPVVAVLAVAGAIIAYATVDKWLPEIASTAVVERFGQEKKHDSFEGRGYIRIIYFPLYTLLGAGEGAWDRFAHLPNQPGEMHSTLGTVVFSYGLAGTLLFFGFVWRIFRHVGMRFVALAAPIALYGLAHQGLRTTLLWVFLGIVMARRWH